MDTPAIRRAVEEQDWLEPVADTVQNATHSAFDALGDASQPVKNALHGTWLGHPLHPVFTDIPIGAWTASVAMDAIEMATGRKDLAPGADAAIAIGIVGATGAAVTGLTDWHVFEEKGPKRTGMMHALLNTVALGCFAASLVMRKKENRAAGHALSLVGLGTVVASAWLGGNLVYEQKVGADHAQREPIPEDFVRVCAEDDLAENTPKKVEVEGVEIVLVRRGQRVFAIGERCMHYGGPLSEGELKGDAIVCPWHASAFDLATGEVVSGPATMPQPCFEARISDGQVEVRMPRHQQPVAEKDLATKVRMM